MENLKQIAASYDRAIELGRKGIYQYTDFPDDIKNDPDFPLFRKMQEEESLSDSCDDSIFRYLAPEAGQRFVDLGCCLNLMSRGYKDWPSTYYGVDISSETIKLLKEFSEKEGIKVGSLDCCSMHKTPYENDFFDIGANIGSLEYFQLDFITQCLAEAHRILKPSARYVLDIPDVGSPEANICAKIEAYYGRPDNFDLSISEFDELVQKYFHIEKKLKAGPMLQYYLLCKE